eukprot:SAG25_NODE_9704_length_361_cov_1.133588_1_plen_33_part_01
MNHQATEQTGVTAAVAFLERQKPQKRRDSSCMS